MSLLGQLFGGAAGSAKEDATLPDFSGRWFTTYGTMELAQDGDRVSGFYEFRAQRCTIEGAVRAGRLQFSYQEPGVAGEGWFELASYGKFTGQWRPQGTQTWSSWIGRRAFEGIWNSSFGLLRLVHETRSRVYGYYEGSGPATIDGRLENGRLTFRYQEPRARGDGWFELTPDAAGFDGQWRAEGKQEWAPWQGRRLAPAPGMCWLVVIETHWQHSYLDREYAFGHMLREFFTRLSHVNVRQRFFEDEAGLQRWCREVMYLPEPVAVVLASHGTEDGLSVQGKPLDTNLLIDSLRHADNLLLVHFSSCLMLKDGKANELARRLQESVQVPVSGYDRSVDWGASALVEFHYFDMVLGRGLSPADAARHLLSLVGYAGESAPADSPYPATGFRILG